MSYNVQNWYWVADDGKVFSSKRGSLVESSDEEFLAWSAELIPSRWPIDSEGNQTDDALQWVFDQASANVYLTLDSLKIALKNRIDQDAESERAKRITAGSGQSMTYQQKATEALSFQKDPSPQLKSYPMLSAEVGVTGKDLVSVAEAVLAAHNAWVLIGAAIEKVRLVAKQRVEQATSVDDANAAASAIVWPQ